MEELVKEKQAMEKELAKLLMQKKDVLANNSNRLNELINKKMPLEVQLHQVESDLTRYSQLSNPQSREDVICPSCEEDIPKSTIQQRLANEYCPLCGIGSLYIDVDEIRSLEQEKTHLKSEIEKIEETLQNTTSFDVEDLVELDRLILDLRSSMERLNIQINMNKQKKNLKDLQEMIKQKKFKINKIQTEIDEMKRAKTIIQEEFDNAIKDVVQALNKRFTQLQNALFDNTMVKISKNFSSNPIERSKFLDFSHTERKLLEICFRLSPCDVLATESRKSSFLIIETPEQDLDSSYKEILAEMLASYHIDSCMKEKNSQKSIKLIISVVDTTFLKLLQNKCTNITILPLYQYSKTISRKQQSLLTSFLQTSLSESHNSSRRSGCQNEANNNAY